MRYAAITLAALAVCLSARTADAQIAWESKLLEAHARAKSEGKLMLLHFVTDNCIYCDRLEAGAFKNPRLASDVNTNFVPLRVHGGKNQLLAKKFGVTKYPTDVIVTTDAKIVSKSVSPQQPERYMAMLTSARADYSRSQVMIAANTAKNTATAAGDAEERPSYARDLAVQVPASKPGERKANQFVMPPAEAGGVSATLASSKAPPAPMVTDVESVDTGLTRPNDIALPSDLAAKPELALQGYCPVSVIENMEWVEGKPEHGVIHLGKLYLFANEGAMEKFLVDPIPFTPVLNGIDVVRFFEERKIVPGKREWGSIDPTHNRMFFFADEEAMVHFEEKFQNYVGPAIEVMDQAIKESNPDA
ncbi:MAG: thioredoxin fold domain-containing protein [Planctomycetota bacterium]